MTCLACGHDRPDICQLLGHQKPLLPIPPELKALPPDAKGIPIREWEIKQVICTPEDLAKYIRERDEARAAAEIPKPKTRTKHNKKRLFEV